MQGRGWRACLHDLLHAVEGLAAGLAHQEEGLQRLAELRLAELARLGAVQGLVYAGQHRLYVLLHQERAKAIAGSFATRGRLRVRIDQCLLEGIMPLSISSPTI